MRGSYKILIVEDNQTDRELVKACLADSGQGDFEFAEEQFGSEALRRYDAFRPDCVFLDLKLPDISGFEFLQAMQQMEHSAPIVVTTAYGNEQVAVNAMKAGATDYLVKHAISASELIHTLENALQKHRLAREIAQQRAALEERNAALEAAVSRERLARAAADEGEQRYRMLTEAIPQIVWTASHPDGAFDHVSQRWRESIGLPIDSALAFGWLEALHSDDRGRVWQSWHDSLASGRQFEIECRLGTPGRGYRWYLARAIPEMRPEKIRRWFGTFTDIEDGKRGEQALLQRQKLESTGLLAGGIAHDFNNLLSAILGGISYALGALPASHETRDLLENALHAGERAAMLTRQMLAYAGKGQFVIEQVDLSGLARSTCDLLRASISKLIHLNIITRHEMPLIEGDSSQIQQIVMNLILNAAEAIGEDKPGIITVRTEARHIDQADAAPDLPQGMYVVLEVIDTGSGMSEETQARIFEPFFTTKFTGRGLGLAAVMGIVRSARGAIQVESTAGKGSTFRVLLPATTARRAEAPRESRSLDSSVKTILVVDDEEVVRRTAAAALSRAGHVVHTATGGKEAIAQVQENRILFDLVLLDMTMPDLSGEQTLRQLRALNPELTVLVTSGYSETEITHRLGGQNVAGFLQKPFSAGTLTNMVAAIGATRHTHV